MTRNGTSKPRRQLRSVDSNLQTTLLDHQPLKDLFDFDPYLRDRIPSRLGIFVSTTLEDDYDEYLHENLDLAYDESKLTLQKQFILNSSLGVASDTTMVMPLMKKRRSHRSKSLQKQREYIKNDPLNDELYVAYHTRMEKEEKKMSNLDKNFMMSEFDKLSEQLKALNVERYKSLIIQDDDDGSALYQLLTNPFDDIARKLQMVTKLNDVRDYKELKLKYKLTIKELNEFIKKHLKLKKIEFELKNEQIQDSDDDEDIKMDVQSLRSKRLKLRNENYGPIWKIIFYNCILVIDPIYPLRIESS